MLRIQDVYPGSWFLPIPDPGSRIPDPKTVTKERGEKKICYHTFFCSHKFYKLEYYVIFEMLKKKIWANFQRIFEVFTPKIFNMLSNIWVWDLGSGIRKKPIPDPGSRGQKGTGSRIRIRNTVWKEPQRVSVKSFEFFYESSSPGILIVPLASFRIYWKVS